VVKHGSESKPEGTIAPQDKVAARPEETASDNPAEKLVDELREAIRVRDDFLAIATHELRNPLTPILLCLQLIRAAEASNDRSKLIHEIDRLERQIKHFLARTNVLLEVAQITSGKSHLDPSKLNLSDLISGIVNDYMPLVVRSGSALTMNIQNEVTAFLDRMAVSEIVENLLSNAIKYGRGKPIEIALTASAETAQITVRDSGIGIDEKDKARIFERFERAVHGQAHSGFGVGLWLSRNLAELMGGSITVFGESGVGSLFTVTLPTKQGKIHE
jgi:signal transduction histidine kinase